ncbi:amidase [Nocardiopsis sp. CT-R113]|uniref:Amidase n=1 Tax=Nocardiopsis codii TaxID=3065942 RepID=A0ABU7KCU9_9ACTN|nr:amidase [Nocardiopsis sp. CT-R113]MEE2040059.1 amidase [Nocardiopsis sp. CT-R113]
MHEYAERDAVALADLVRTGQVRADEVERVARLALERAHDDLNALTGPLFESVPLPSAAGPLGGVPFVVKDSGPFARGVRFTLGSRAVDAVATADHTLMSRFRAAGLVPLGQSTAPELGLHFATESARHGITRNPWNLGRGAGGSSGGSAALVAAGAVPLAHGNDGAGSLRVPASACGVIGLKPTRGRTPCGRLAGEAGFGLITEFGLTRTVRDTARLLDAVCAPPVGEKFVVPAPHRPYAEAARTDPGRLRIAVTTTPWADTRVDTTVAEAALDAARVLEWIGHTVEEDHPHLDPEDVVEGTALAALAAGTALLRAPRRPGPALMEDVSRAVLSEARRCTALEVAAMLDAQHRVTHPLGAFLDRYDLLVTPTLGRLPAPHGALDYDAPGHSVRSWLRALLAYGPFTAPFNVAGQPAISLPLAQSPEGLPIGVQLVAAHGREDLLLAVAAQLEQAVPWGDRRPPFHV